jgi:TrmH family RNA methyltransferase
MTMSHRRDGTGSGRQAATGPVFPPLSREGIRRVREAVAKAQEREDPYLVLEGDHLLEEALRSDSEPVIVVVAPGLWSEPARRAMSRLLRRDWDVHSVTGDEFERLAPSRHPGGILAIVNRPPALDVSRWVPRGLALLAAGIQDPGNLGTIMRAAEAFGAEALIVTADTASPANPKVVRASSGSVLRLPVGLVDNVVAALRRYREQDVTIVAADAHRGMPLRGVTLPRPALLVLGAEAAGVPASLDPLIDLRLRIPLAEPVESLNVAVSAALILYEVSR